MKVTTVYDNEVYPDADASATGLKGEWGFSCLIEVSGERILFDTGGDGSILLHNMGRLGIDPEDLGKVVLSHEHWDHAGGIPDLLDLNRDAEIYLLASFSELFKSKIRNPVIEVNVSAEICDLVCTTGELGSDIREQSLVLETKNGVVVVTGCAHPGIGAIMGRASEFGEICGIMGGFHGFCDYPVLNGMKFLSPCHCTQHLQEIASRFPGAYQRNGVGRVFTFE
ncbi:MAG: MBL fold metallo-hydrolase [Euryarchaeota archaeon]|nr:MBL fold metallo-hydrolase [Euryarchaeota archaeon]